MTEVIEDGKIGASLVKTMLDILFQIGLVTIKATQSTEEFIDNKDGVSLGAGGKEIFLICYAAGKHRLQGSMGAPEQDTKELQFFEQLIRTMLLQEFLLGGGEGTGIETMFISVGVAKLSTSFLF